MKRALDFTLALAGLLALAPALALIAAAVWLEDFRSPFFPGRRVGMGNIEFRMIKFRSMASDAWKSGVNSTAAGDARLTRVGAWLRRSKLDELPQLLNVLAGNMSLVGPRPQVITDVELYTEEEREMLTVQPGITDLASIVFADEGEILFGAPNPDLLYNQIIRPWKSRLAMFHVEHRSNALDLEVIWLTALAMFSRQRALAGVGKILDRWGAEEIMRRMASRREPLMAYPPPGSREIVADYPRSVVHI